MRYQTVFAILILFLFPLYAEDYLFDIPGIGETGIKYEGGDTYAAAIPGLGLYEFHGYVNSENDFDLSVELPTADIVGYIPVAGQILGLFGVDSTTYRLIPAGLGINAHFEDGGLGSLRGLITEALEAVPGAQSIVDEVIGLLEIVEMDLDALIIDKTLRGSVSGVLSLANKRIGFSETGEISSSSLVKALMVDLPLAVIEFGAEKYLQVMGPVVKAVGGAIADGAEAVYREALIVGHDITTSLNHGTHNFDECYYECVPNYTSAKADKMLLGANKFTLDYYTAIGFALNQVQGKTNEETVSMRMEIIGASWAALGSELDKKWQKIYDDDEVENYFFKNSSEKAGRNKHKQIVQAAWDRNRAYRAGIGANLLYINNPLDIMKYWAQAGKAVTMTHRDTSLSMEVFNAGTWNGVNVLFNENNCGNNQMWYLHEAGEKDTYYIQSASSGLYIHISGANDTHGSSLVGFSGKGGKQTKFKATVDLEGFVHWTSLNGYAFDLMGGIPQNGADLVLGNFHGGRSQQFTVLMAPVQPAVKPGEYFVASFAPAGNLFLTVENRNQNGANLFLGLAIGDNTQKFQITGAQAIGGRQTYRLYNFASSRFLHLQAGIFRRGTNILSWDGWGGENTRFFFDYPGDGTMVISARGGNVFECDGKVNKVGHGSNVMLYHDAGEADQRWLLSPVTLY